MKILVTGSTGFLGSHLVAALILRGYFVRATTRNSRSNNLNAMDGLEYIFNVDMSTSVNWMPILADVGTVIHLAAHVHRIGNKAGDEAGDYMRINVDGAINIASYAAMAGVKRFIYISSIKVNGEKTKFGAPFTPEDVPNPQGCYAISKYKAELALAKIAERSGMELVIIRPPLIYGPGVKANFLKMIKLATFSIPLPFSSVKNLRSFVYVDNLVDLILRCIKHPEAKNQIFLVSDGDDISTPSLLQQIGCFLGLKAILFPFPVMWLYFLGGVFGCRDVIDRLCSSLQLDISKTCRILGWAPIISTKEGLFRTIRCKSNKNEANF